MKKIILLIMILFITSSVFSQESPPLTIGYWVFMEEGTLRNRVVNEFETAVKNSEEWQNMIAIESEWYADIHIIFSGMRLNNTDIYAWSITYTPIEYPRYTNGRVYSTGISISDMNWIARSAVTFLEEELFVLLDDINNGDI